LAGSHCPGSLILVGYGLFRYAERWKPYDPTWLVELAKQQRPDDVRLHEALKRCTRILGNSFVKPKRPNHPGSEWQFKENITLEHPEFGDIVLDVLKDGRIGGIEYLVVSEFQR